MAAHVKHNSGLNEWYTPAWVVDAVRRAMGSIDLDPASSAEANNVVRAGHYCTVEDNGLTLRWYGNVYLNSPYGRQIIGAFVEKALAEWRSEDGRVNQMCILVNNATETDWFQALLAAASAVCFFRRRIQFWTPERPSASPLQGQVMFGFCPVGPFADVFREHGAIYAPDAEEDWQ